MPAAALLGRQLGLDSNQQQQPLVAPGVLANRDTSDDCAVDADLPLVARAQRSACRFRRHRPLSLDR